MNPSRSQTLARWRSLPALALLLFAPACRLSDVPLWQPAPPHLEACAVQRVRDVVYHPGPWYDGCRGKLDLFLPEGRQGFPVVVLVHGGAWMIGDNRSCGLYPAVAEFLARHGIGVVLPNYHLSPWARHPEHAQDVARAVAWAYAHSSDFGGDPGRLVLAGHSAGGHLVALLATDESYLKAEGVPASALRGVVALSGVYDIPPVTPLFTLGGATPLAFRLNQVLPIRRPCGRGWAGAGLLPGLPMPVNVFRPAFGTDPYARALASPINHVRPGLPPFLILSAERDLPTLPAMAEAFHQALVAQGCDSRLVTVAGRNHNSILFHALDADDPVGHELLEFIVWHAGE